MSVVIRLVAWMCDRPHPFVDRVPRCWLVELAEHLEAESAYFVREGEEDEAVTLAARAADVRARL